MYVQQFNSCRRTTYVKRKPNRLPQVKTPDCRTFCIANAKQRTNFTRLTKVTSPKGFWSKILAGYGYGVKA